ncbi:hypothetical protein [Streptomyces aureoversilis]|uniref:Uncharacterized protein n=1 Tax=Streptomyces aureoversilis TaxID=67277 RepID=A0ABW0A5X4_9ACTN
MPPPAAAHHRPYPLATPRGPRTTSTPPLAPSRAPDARELAPEEFTAVPGARSTEDLAAGLTRQLLPLLAAGAAQPGDVLVDPNALAHTLGGPRATAQGTLILRSVATRYGLVRNRPLRPGDPPSQLGLGHTMTWEISPAADVLADALAAELDVPARGVTGPPGPRSVRP